MFTDSGKLLSIHSNHTELIDLRTVSSLARSVPRRDSYLAESPQVEKSQPDDLVSYFLARFMVRTKHTHANLCFLGKYSSLVVEGNRLTFLSDLEAPEGVQPVVYSPFVHSWFRYS